MCVCVYVCVIWESMISAVSSCSTHNIVLPVEDVVGIVGVGDGVLRSVEEPTRGSDVLVGTGGKNGEQ